MYIIDLESKVLRVEKLTKEQIAYDLEFFGVKNIEELNDFDWRVFKTAAKAEAWLKKYNTHLKNLKLLSENRNLPKACLTLKTRYLVQTAMSEKLFTIRHYEKKWKTGQQFYFHNQKHYVLVKLTALEQTAPGEFKYTFSVEK